MKKIRDTTLNSARSSLSLMKTHVRNTRMTNYSRYSRVDTNVEKKDGEFKPGTTSGTGIVF